MPKATHVKAAAKDYPAAGIKKGESYYWWAFPFGVKRMQRTPPRPSQLTQSDFTSRQLEIGERIDGLSDNRSMEDLGCDVEAIVGDIRALGEEQSDKLSNMPDSLQQGPTGELLQSRADACEKWADALEAVSLDMGEPTEDDAEMEVLEDKPKREDISDEDLGEEQTIEQKLEELNADYEQAKKDKLEEMQEAYMTEVENAINELQGCTYEGE